MNKVKMYFNIIDNFSNNIDSLPPLYLHVNPKSIRYSYTKKITRKSTFGAIVEEHWGDELDSIACSGSTGAFIVEDATGGLSTLKQSQTRAYFKFQDLIDIYRNNGCVYDENGRIIQKGSVLLSFSEGSYLGFFEVLNYIEDASSPFQYLYDFTFKVEKSLMVI